MCATRLLAKQCEVQRDIPSTCSVHRGTIAFSEFNPKSTFTMMLLNHANVCLFCATPHPPCRPVPVSWSDTKHHRITRESPPCSSPTLSTFFKEIAEIYAIYGIYEAGKLGRQTPFMCGDANMLTRMQSLAASGTADSPLGGSADFSADRLPSSVFFRGPGLGNLRFTGVRHGSL